MGLMSGSPQHPLLRPWERHTAGSTPHSTSGARLKALLAQGCCRRQSCLYGFRRGPSGSGLLGLALHSG